MLVGLIGIVPSASAEKDGADLSGPRYRPADFSLNWTTAMAALSA